jgi:molecular chaperone GrpE
MSRKSKEKNEKETQESPVNENNNTTDQQAEDHAAEVAEPSEEEKLKLELAAMNDKYLRLYAEFDNYRRRTAKQQLDMQRIAAGESIKNILPVLDDFERAIASNTEIADTEVLKQGFELIYTKMKHILEKSGLKEIEAKGKPFDTDLHEAITNIPAPDDNLKGKVVDVVEKGYYLNDHVLRFSKVVVGQ